MLELEAAVHAAAADALAAKELASAHSTEQTAASKILALRIEQVEAEISRVAAAPDRQSPQTPVLEAPAHTSADRELRLLVESLQQQVAAHTIEAETHERQLAVLAVLPAQVSRLAADLQLVQTEAEAATRSITSLRARGPDSASSPVVGLEARISDAVSSATSDLLDMVQSARDQTSDNTIGAVTRVCVRVCSGCGLMEVQNCSDCLGLRMHCHCDWIGTERVNTGLDPH
jgi:hypothetical protein